MLLIYLTCGLILIYMGELKIKLPAFDWIGIHDLAKTLECPVVLLVQEASKGALTLCVIGDGLGIYAFDGNGKHGSQYIPVVHHCSGYPGCVIVLSKEFFKVWINEPDKKIPLNRHEFFLHKNSLGDDSGYRGMNFYAVNAGDSRFSRSKKYYNAHTINNTESLNDVMEDPDIEICLTDVVVLREEKERYLKNHVGVTPVQIIEKETSIPEDKLLGKEKEEVKNKTQPNTIVWKGRAAELCLELAKNPNQKVGSICSQVEKILIQEKITGRGGHSILASTIERMVWQSLAKEGKVPSKRAW